MSRVDRFQWGKLGRSWLARAAHDPVWQEWQRVGFIAWQRAGLDGVATFARGELAEAAAAIDKDTGEVARLGNAPRAVRRAIAAGMIEPGSTTRRLIVHGGVYAVGRY